VKKDYVIIQQGHTPGNFIAQSCVSLPHMLIGTMKKIFFQTVFVEDNFLHYYLPVSQARNNLTQCKVRLPSFFGN